MALTWADNLFAVWTENTFDPKARAIIPCRLLKNGTIFVLLGYHTILDILPAKLNKRVIKMYDHHTGLTLNHQFIYMMT